MKHLSEHEIVQCVGWVANPNNPEQGHAAAMALLTNFNAMSREIADLKVQLALSKASQRQSSSQ
ncbi:MAG: hypothetical protein ACRCXB_13975 [Aeromonadaceae bacterium]